MGITREPNYVLVLPADQVLLRAEVEAEAAPVFDAMVADRRWSDLLDRRRWWVEGRGSEPIAWLTTNGDGPVLGPDPEPKWHAGVIIRCPRCGRRVAARRDWMPVRHKALSADGAKQEWC